MFIHGGLYRDLHGLFKRLCLLFLPNVPGAMFIQGGTFILDSRVCSSFDSNPSYYFLNRSIVCR